MLFPTVRSRCQINQTTIVSTENKLEHRAINQDKDTVYHYKIDGDVIDAHDSCIRCDYLLENETKHHVYLIELKGSDVEHAANQIISTINMFKNELECYTIFPRIVYRSVTHKMLGSKPIIRLKEEYGARFKIKTRVMEDII